MLTTLGTVADKIQCSLALVHSASMCAAALGPPSNFYPVWPTVEEVRKSYEGWRAGGSLPGVSSAPCQRCG